MKANELMIGDWVLYNPNVFIEDEYESPKDCYLTKISCGEDIDLAIEDCYSPIPLTAEILEKNGFDISDKEVMQYHFEEDGKKYHFSLRQMYDKDGKPHGYSFYAFNVLTLLDYVHELQHALRLCGIEKEIEL